MIEENKCNEHYFVLYFLLASFDSTGVQQMQHVRSLSKLKITHFYPLGSIGSTNSDRRRNKLLLYVVV